MRISDWSSDVCSSDLAPVPGTLTPSVSWNHPTARDARAMQQHELDALFDQQAAGYDTQWARMAPIRDSLHFLLETVFAGLPDDARLLCVGAGTGAAIAPLAERFPGWRFLARSDEGRGGKEGGGTGKAGGGRDP